MLLQKQGVNFGAGEQIPSIIPAGPRARDYIMFTGLWTPGPEPLSFPVAA